MQILRDLMAIPVMHISPTATVAEAVGIMTENQIGSLVVEREETEEAIGILTNSDIVRRLVAEGRDATTTKVEDICSTPLITVDFMLSVDYAHNKMMEHNIKRLAVTEHKKVVGMFTARDLMQAT